MNRKVTITEVRLRELIREELGKDIGAGVMAINPLWCDWRPIATAPRDGTPFIAWTTENGLELEARFNPEHGHFETYGRVDYDQDDWSEDPGCATHWLPYPEKPNEANTKAVDKEETGN